MLTIRMSRTATNPQYCTLTTLLPIIHMKKKEKRSRQLSNPAIRLLLIRMCSMSCQTRLGKWSASGAEREGSGVLGHHSMHCNIVRPSLRRGLDFGGHISSRRKRLQAALHHEHLLI